MMSKRGFSYNSVQNAALKMKLGIKPEYDFSDKFSMEDVSKFWRNASIKVFGGKTDNE